MEDNNAINKQPDAVKPTYEELVEANNQLNEAANHWYQIAKQLESTWKLQRASFLFEIIKSDYFKEDIKEKAAKELTDFIFPKITNKNTENEVK